MSKATGTAGKTASRATGNRARRNALRERIGRTRYALLSKMAKSLNGVSWAERDNTPETLYRNFRLWSERPANFGYTLVQTIATGAPEGTPEDMRRRRELEDALEVHGIRVAQYAI